MTHPFHSERKRSFSIGAFSLVELLVVLGILAALTTLIFAGVRTALPAAQSAKCVGNLRQLVSGLIAYAGDHDGVFPPCYSYVKESPWMAELGEQGYLPLHRDDQNFSLWHCPSWAPRSPGSPSGRAPWLATYGMVLLREDVAQPRLSQLSVAVPLLADSLAEEGGTRVQHYYVVAGVSSNPNRFHLRHQGGVNVAFTDGRVNRQVVDALKDVEISGFKVNNWSTNLEISK